MQIRVNILPLSPESQRSCTSQSCGEANLTASRVGVPVRWQGRTSFEHSFSRPRNVQVAHLIQAGANAPPKNRQIAFATGRHGFFSHPSHPWTGSFYPFYKGDLQTGISQPVTGSRQDLQTNPVPGHHVGMQFECPILFERTTPASENPPRAMKNAG